MNTLEERLRERAKMENRGQPFIEPTAALLNEAAAEITRLKSAVKDWSTADSEELQRIYNLLGISGNDSALDEITRIKSALEASRKAYHNVEGTLALLAAAPPAPTTSSRPEKEAVINLRISRQDLALIDAAADVEGKTRSAFLRDCAERAATSVAPARPEMTRESVARIVGAAMLRVGGVVSTIDQRERIANEAADAILELGKDPPARVWNDALKQWEHPTPPGTP